MKAIKNIFRPAFFSIGIAIFSSAMAVWGATVTVSSGDYFFSPASVTINVGDSVTWTGLPAGGHTTTSTTSLWNSSANNFTFTFTNAGTNSYYCIPHQSLGMVGTVIVKAANVPPTVTITNPASGNVFSAPASVTIQAAVSDSDSTVTNVQFLVGATVLTNNTTAPFFAVSNNLAAGNYTLSAIATDGFGEKATNSVTISVVTPLPLAISTPQSSFAGFQFNYPANVGLSYVIQRTTNLAAGNWIPVVTNVAASNPVVFADIHATNNQNFYRVGRLPNP